jgi:heat shock protein HslJ
MARKGGRPSRKSHAIGTWQRSRVAHPDPALGPGLVLEARPEARDRRARPELSCHGDVCFPVIRILLAVPLAFALTACSGAAPSPSPTPSAPPAADVDLNGSWQLEQGTVRGEAIPILDTHRITLVVEAPTAGGIAACNHYGGSITVAGDEVVFSALSQTEMACDPPESMEAEQRYLTGLAQVHTGVREGDTLVLTGVGVELRFNLQPPVPEAALVDTEWILESLIDGDVASSTAGHAKLELLPDGTFAGSTGCRELSGRYMIYGDTVQVTEMGAHGECPPELSDQDGRVIGVIEGPFTVAIEGNTLTITSSGNQGLVFHSAD